MLEPKGIMLMQSILIIGRLMGFSDGISGYVNVLGLPLVQTTVHILEAWTIFH